MIYLDHNATTPLRVEVWEAMSQVELGPEELRNPSSVHKPGLAARKAVRRARETVAAAVGAQADEIVFTGGGSEAINLAIKGAVWSNGEHRPHVISTQIEHHAVLHAVQWLQTRGVDVTLLPVDERCQVAPQAVLDALTPGTVLVSVMHVNNEVGTVQPVADIGAICREHGVLFHVDAVQALGKTEINVADIQCDLLSCSAHKIGGPRGVGMLYIRQGTQIEPLVHGGPQENKLRAGTENVAGLVGFAKAVELALAERDELNARWLRLREELYRLPRELDAVRVNSAPETSVPNCVNMAFMYCDGMALATNLSRKNVCVSTGSACTAGDLEPSHVLKAMGLSDRAAHGAIRFSMGRDTTLEDVTEAVETTKSIVSKLRLITMPEDIGVCKDDCPCFLTG